MTQDKDKLKIIPLGGLGAIGKNMTVFEYVDDLIIVDCGIMFPTDEQPGIDFLIPDFSYVVRNRHRVRAILVTHGHEDHIGAIPYLLQEVNAPIYATRLTLGLIQSRLQEKPPREMPVLTEISPRDVVHIGTFVVEFLQVNHSIIDGVALAIGTPLGTVIHTGDFKIDFSPVDGMVTDLHRFAEYGEKGVLLLMSDSTNAERSGFTRSESVLSGKLIDIFSSSKGRIIVASFASNINRIQQVLDAAQRYNRKVIVSGITMQKNIDIARELDCLKFREEMLIDVKEASRIPSKKQVVICTGTQGEPMSALARMASGTHKHFSAGEGDTVVITASVIPGNERMVNNVINSLMRMGADVYYEQDEDIHVSGHGSQEELKLILSLTKPRFFMPIHGEFKMLKAHARLAESLKIKGSRIILAENGQIIEMTSRSFDITGHLNPGNIFVDSGDIGNLDSGLIRDRHVLATEGILFVTLIMSRGRLAGGPEVVSRGIVDSANVRLLQQIREDIEEQLDKVLGDGLSAREISGFLRKSLKTYLNKLTRRNPLIEILILEV